MSKKILFRTDSSSKIGLGHVMRDLVLAKQFKDDEILFACQNLEGNIMDKIPYPKIVLNSNSIDELIMIIKKENIDLLVIDHYEIGFKEEKEIKQKTGVKIFVLDDTYEKHYCDILLNHNIYANKKKYIELVPKSCQIQCGEKYTLIRDEFKNQIIKHYKKDGIFISFGGTDTQSNTLKTLKILKQFKKKVYLHITSSNKNLKKIKQYALYNKWIVLKIDTDVSTSMAKSYLAIITTSTIFYEAVFMKLKIIGIKVASNQHELYQYAKKKGFLVFDKFNSSKIKKAIQNELKTKSKSR